MSFRENTDFNSIFIRKRNDKYCVIGQYIGLDGKEKQKTLVSCTSKEDAEKEKIKIKAALLENRFIDSPDATLYDRYMEYYSDPLKNLSHTTEYVAKKIGEKYACFLNVKLKNLDVKTFKRMLQRIYSLDLKENTKKSIVSKIRAVVRECELNKEIPLITPYVKISRRNATAAEAIKQSEKRFCLTEEEVKQLLNYTPTKGAEKTAMLCIYTFLETGVRFGEMAGLKWESVDFNKKQIKIKNNLQWDSKAKKLIDIPPKGKKIRTISISDTLLGKYQEELKKQKELVSMGLMDHLEYVHLNTQLRPFQEGTAVSCIKKTMQAAGIEPINIHALRHTHATMLLKSDVPVSVVSKRLGHTQTSLTMDVYVHALEDDSKAAAGMIDIFIDD